MNLAFKVSEKPGGTGVPRSAVSRVAYSSLPTSIVGLSTLLKAIITADTAAPSRRLLIEELEVARGDRQAPPSPGILLKHGHRSEENAPGSRFHAVEGIQERLRLRSMRALDQRCQT